MRLTGTAGIVYGVSVLIPIAAVYSPGWVKSGRLASRVTVTLADLPAATVSSVALSDSHGTSADEPHWLKPGSVSPSATGGANAPPGLPPIRYRPQALPARYRVWLALGSAVQVSAAGS